MHGRRITISYWLSCFHRSLNGMHSELQMANSDGPAHRFPWLSIFCVDTDSESLEENCGGCATASLTGPASFLSAMARQPFIPGSHLLPLLSMGCCLGADVQSAAGRASWCGW